MDPIGTTYAGLYSVIQSPEKRESTATNAKAAASTTASPSATVQPSGSSEAAYVQIGINTPSGNQDNFRTYNSEGRIGNESRKAVTADQADKTLTTQPEQKQKEDPQVQQTIARLKATEEKVKAHEAAHKSAGGAATGPISYTYTRGPDGRNYITGGEVPITISSGSTPQETISRMQQVIQAALAPADPSPQDRAVAAQAANIKQQAQQEKAQTVNSQSASDTEASANISATPATKSTGNDKPQEMGKINLAGQVSPLSGYPTSTAAGSNPARPISVYA